jgi:hypothetical protein
MFKTGNKNKTTGTKFEKKVLKQTTRIQPGSGNKFYNPNDIKTETELIECKTTGSKSLSIKKEWLDKVFTNSIIQNRMPVLTFGFQDSDQTYAIIRYEDYKQLKEGD